MAGILTALFGATACGNAETKVVYQYSETAVSDDNLRITKTVYTPGKMKLYYTGKRFHDNWVLCYDANFNQLNGEYQCEFERNALTIEADFAEKIKYEFYKNLHYFCGESPLTLRPNFNCEKGSVTAAAAACMPRRGIFVDENL